MKVCANQNNAIQQNHNKATHFRSIEFTEPRHAARALSQYSDRTQL